MAWIDNRAWAHPKLLACTIPARWVWISGICYSSGFGTRGRLNPEQQRMIGSTPKIRRELENAGLWLDEGPDVAIHDWDEHNGERDERAERKRRLDRERQARRRSQQRDSPDSHAGRHADNPRDIACLKDEGVTGDVSTRKEGDLIELHKAMQTIGRTMP